MTRQTALSLPTPDGKTIYGELIDGTEKPLIIFCHGLTGRHNDRVPYNAAWFFADNGFSTYRFSFYYHKENARDILECTLETHADDLDTVVEYFRSRGCKQVYVAGHSFGGLTVLLSKRQAFDKAILWDPSHPAVDPFQDTKYNQEMQAFIAKSGVNYVYGEPMVDHFQNLQVADYIEARATPTLVIGAGSSPLAKTNKLYFNALPVEKEFHVIENSDHGFASEGAQDELFKLTLKWLSK